MKQTLFLLTLLLPLFISAQKTYPAQVQESAVLHKKAAVKTIKTYVQYGEDDKVLASQSFIDKNGFITKKIEKVEEDANRTSFFEYNKKGNLIKKTEKDDDGTIAADATYIYNSNDQLIAEKHLVEGENYTVRYSYNSVGQIDSSFVSSAEFRQNVWKYNKKGKLEAILGYSVYDFDNPEEPIQVNTDEFLYDNDLLISISNCYSSIGCFIDRYTYNKSQQRVSCTLFQKEDSTEEEVATITYEYNNKGLLISELSIGSENSNNFASDNKTTYEYSYH